MTTLLYVYGMRYTNKFCLFFIIQILKMGSANFGFRVHSHVWCGFDLLNLVNVLRKRFFYSILIMIQICQHLIRCNKVIRYVFKAQIRVVQGEFLAFKYIYIFEFAIVICIVYTNTEIMKLKDQTVNLDIALVKLFSTFLIYTN